MSTHFKSFFDNIILNTDSYKASHYLQYPPRTTRVFSYVESRGGVYDRTLFFGLQGYIKTYLVGHKRVTMPMINEAEMFWKYHGEPFNREGWEYIYRVHDGRLPVRIRAVAEGSVVPTHNVLFTIENTDPKCFWLTSYLETSLLRAIWYPTTVATQSWFIKQDIKHQMEKSCDTFDGLPFKLHDFGARGVSSMESAAVGGASHLINFQGTDTAIAAIYANQLYNMHGHMAGYSIPAAEHSSITSWGKDKEIDAYRNMLTQFAKPGTMVAVVSDSYDIYNAVDNIWGDALRQEVIDSGALVIIRPDSGDPPHVVLKTLELLANRFGYTENTKGYKVLNHVRVIQGDGVNRDSINAIMNNIVGAGFSVDNVAFGSGGALLQKLNRDTQKFALKCSAAEVDGKWIDVFKDPVTDRGKLSKKGRVELCRPSGGDYYTIALDADEPIPNDSAMHTVFKDGYLVKDMMFSDVRENSER